MVGPYDHTDMWLDKYLPEWDSGGRPSTTRGISQLAISLLWFLVLAAIALDLLFLAFGSSRGHFAAGWGGRGLAVLVALMAAFTFGYVVHSGKRWLLATRRGESRSHHSPR